MIYFENSLGDSNKLKFTHAPVDENYHRQLGPTPIYRNKDCKATGLNTGRKLIKTIAMKTPYEGILSLAGSQIQNLAPCP